MPVRNGEPWIQASLRSLLRQTYTSFNVLLVDDSSTDESVALARKVLGDRLDVVKSQGTGIANALATGVRRSQQEIICRMDVDDVAHTARLAQQIEFLTKNPDYVLVGSNVQLMDMDGAPIGRSHFPLTDAAIRLRMTIANPFAHSAVAFRRAAVLEAGNYMQSGDAPFPEDYELWTRLSHLGRFANLPDILLSYRMNPSGIMQSHEAEMRSHAAAIASEWLASYAVQVNLSDFQVAAWQRYLDGSDRISIREATQVVYLMLSVRLRTQQRLFDPGYRLGHYLRPLRSSFRIYSRKQLK